eukprot:scaffold1760_cov131-Alexandrium_tamarense.AAC.1
MFHSSETCFDENHKPESCAPHADGGCPCPSGEERCGAYEGYLGYCTSDVCCDYETEGVYRRAYRIIHPAFRVHSLLS